MFHRRHHRCRARQRSSPAHSLNRKYCWTLCPIWGIRYRRLRTAGTHYTDITGEVDFIARMSERYAEQARASGARLVSFCGFDSVPAELAVHKLAQRFGPEEELTIQSYYTTKGGLNGGTIATMLNKLASGRDNQRVGPDVLVAARQDTTRVRKKVEDKITITRNLPP